jgi:hypothetical protein
MVTAIDAANAAAVLSRSTEVWYSWQTARAVIPIDNSSEPAQDRVADAHAHLKYPGRIIEEAAERGLIAATRCLGFPPIPARSDIPPSQGI